MAELIARGPKTGQQWRRRLPDERKVILGRNAGDWTVPWDPFISREHAALTWRKGMLHVDKLPAAPNPAFYHGEEANQFSLSPGDHFVIGETTFLLTIDQASASDVDPAPVQERTVSANE